MFKPHKKNTVFGSNNTSWCLTRQRYIKLSNLATAIIQNFEVASRLDIYHLFWRESHRFRRGGYGQVLLGHGASKVEESKIQT